LIIENWLLAIELRLVTRTCFCTDAYDSPPKTGGLRERDLQLLSFVHDDATSVKYNLASRVSAGELDRRWFACQQGGHTLRETIPERGQFERVELQLA
jgi:hypothetical protein